MTPRLMLHIQEALLKILAHPSYITPRDSGVEPVKLQSFLSIRFSLNLIAENYYKN